MPGKTGPATVSWAIAAPIVGGDLPAVGTCYIPPVVAVPATVPTTTVPRETFVEPGPHTISATQHINVNVAVMGFTTVLQGSGTLHITFHRVNADGSPFTG
jgi:hypothetical protein